MEEYLLNGRVFTLASTSVCDLKPYITKYISHGGKLCSWILAVCYAICLV